MVSSICSALPFPDGNEPPGLHRQSFIRPGAGPVSCHPLHPNQQDAGLELSDGSNRLSQLSQACLWELAVRASR